MVDVAYVHNDMATKMCQGQSAEYFTIDYVSKV